MLVALSDLHFVDGSAGEHNLNPEAFRRVFAADILGLVESKGIREVDLLLLGDTFDLVRTEAWFGVPSDERPWGGDPEACLGHAAAILDAILEHRDPSKAHVDNPAIFRFLRDELPARLAAAGVERTTIHYVPGNHDRLINAAPALRDRVAAALGVDLDGGWFANAYRSERYGVIARHGHEFDPLNCAAGVDPYAAPADPAEIDARRRAYAESTSIGDVITAELAAKIPYLVRRRLADPDPRLVERFQEIENVRPLSHVFHFLRYQARSAGELRGVIERVLAETLEDFVALPFVRDYDRRHGPFDIVDKIQVAAAGLRLLGVDGTLKLARAFGVRDSEAEEDDACVKAALAEPGIRDLDDPIRFAIYGHTHGPVVRPLASPRSPDFSRIKESHYVNVGTWRARHRLTADREAFTTLQSMTYAVVFAADEDPIPGVRKPPTLEIWTGARKKYFL
jgi:UDP-2,3-diacylglucosamine pyrophosphatase LpxH